MINQAQRFKSSAFRQRVTIKQFVDPFEREFIEQEITAIITQPSPKDLERLAEGERSFGTLKIFSLFELKLGDRVLFKGKEYRVTVTGDWGTYGYYYNLATELASTQKNNSGGFIVT